MITRHESGVTIAKKRGDVGWYYWGFHVWRVHSGERCWGLRFRIGPLTLVDIHWQGWR